MIRRPEGPPTRWTEGGAQDALGRRAADLFNLPPPAPLGSVRREQIARRLAAGSAHAGLPLLVKAGGVAAVTVGIAIGIAHFASTPAEPRQPRTVTIPSPPVAPVTATPDPGPGPAKASSATRASSARSDRGRGATKIAGNTFARPSRAPSRSSEVENPPPLPSVSPAPSAPLPPPSPPREPASAPRAPAASPSAAPQTETYLLPPITYQDEPVGPPPPRSEPRLLADALARLHAEGDAKGALVLLAEHRRRFPKGALRSEARVAEVESLLSLDRRSDALRVLDGLDIERMPRGAELLVLRAELRAQAGRCADAIADFNRCAASAGCSPESEERALFGRASCRGELGQTAAARADLERYLLRFPHGRRSQAVRRALGEKN